MTADAVGALAQLARAAAAEPANAAIHVRLGDALLALGRVDDAHVVFEATIVRAPADAAAYNGLGVARDRLGRYAGALEAFRAAVALDPQFAEAHSNLARLLVATGAIDEAAGWFERALALEPRNGRFYLGYVTSRNGRVDAPLIARMEALAAQGKTLPPVDRIELAFALASAYEEAGRLDDAFAQLALGNRLKRATLRYDVGVDERVHAALARTFSAALVAALRGGGNPSDRPLFIIGMPRSGTTLVEALLAAVPGVTGGGELHALEACVRACWPTLLADGPPAAVPPNELRARLRAIGDGYVRATDALAGDAVRLTDKLPHNFVLAPLVTLALPNARLIHVRRDPVDVCFSCYATLFADASVPYAYDLGELGRFYRSYERLMTAWRALLPADRFIEIAYERLVADFETEARRLVAFCGLAWDPAVRAFSDVQRPVRTASAVQVRRPLYAGAVGRGRRFAAHLGPLLRTLADEPSTFM